VNDKLIAQLREEAQRFDPKPLPGLRRRLIATIADAPASHRTPTMRISWPVAACATAATVAIAVTAFVLRDHARIRTPLVIVPQTRQWATKTLPSPGVLASANPVSLAHRWVEQPLQTEVDTWMNHLTSAGGTVTSVFPAPVKRTHAPASTTKQGKFDPSPC
jgi:hypothetical protein